MDALIPLAAWLHAGLCALVVLFHGAVILGAPLGRLTQGGRHDGALPPLNRLFAAVSAGLMVGVALAVLAAAGQGPDWPRWVGWSGVVLGGLAGGALVAAMGEAGQAIAVLPQGWALSEALATGGFVLIVAGALTSRPEAAALIAGAYGAAAVLGTVSGGMAANLATPSRIERLVWAPSRAGWPTPR